MPRVRGVQLASNRNRPQEPGAAGSPQEVGAHSARRGAEERDARARSLVRLSGRREPGAQDAPYAAARDYERDADHRAPYGSSREYGYDAHPSHSDLFEPVHEAPHDSPYTAARGTATELFDRAARALRSLPVPAYIAIACVIAVLLIVPGAVSRNAARAAEEEAARAAEAQAAKKRELTEAERLEELGFELRAPSFDEVPSEDGLQTFSLAGLSEPVLSDGDRSAVLGAIGAIEQSGPATVMFVDVQTGRGLAYQPDLVVYGASSFKALYSLYVCQQFIEPGAESLDAYRTVNVSVGPDGYAAGASYPLSSLIEGAITQSSNNAYGALRNTFDTEGYDEWAMSLGANDALYRADSWFPTYSARTSARLWSEMLAYAQGGSETAQWLYDLTGSTEVSFIRAGLEQTGAIVHDKAGWCTDQDPAYNSVSDAGIVQIDGRTYIMSILTGMPDSEANRSMVGDLAKALIDSRGALGIQDGSGQV